MKSETHWFCFFMLTLRTRKVQSYETHLLRTYSWLGLSTWSFSYDVLSLSINYIAKIAVVFHAYVNSIIYICSTVLHLTFKWSMMNSELIFLIIFLVFIRALTSWNVLKLKKLFISKLKKYNATNVVFFFVSGIQF